MGGGAGETWKGKRPVGPLLLPRLSSRHRSARAEALSWLRDSSVSQLDSTLRPAPRAKGERKGRLNRSHAATLCLCIRI